jgi:hypothetical protein
VEVLSGVYPKTLLVGEETAKLLALLIEPSKFLKLGAITCLGDVKFLGDSTRLLSTSILD